MVGVVCLFVSPFRTIKTLLITGMETWRQGLFQRKFGGERKLGSHVQYWAYNWAHGSIPIFNITGMDPLGPINKYLIIKYLKSDVTG